MARIMTVSAEEAQGPRREIVARAQREYGYLPGIAKILLTDLELASAASKIYTHLNLRPTSPLTRLQREMLATVVNGLVGGAP